MEAVLTILKIYEKDMIDLLYNEAVDLISLLDNELLEIFFMQNPKFVELSTGDCMNLRDLKEMIDILVEHIVKL